MERVPGFENTSHLSRARSSMDRVRGFEPRGWGFESLRAYWAVNAGPGRRTGSFIVRLWPYRHLLPAWLPLTLHGPVSGSSPGGRPHALAKHSLADSTPVHIGHVDLVGIEPTSPLSGTISEERRP
jgi:hypothetical protein